jgi:hypothetical protein
MTLLCACLITMVISTGLALAATTLPPTAGVEDPIGKALEALQPSLQSRTGDGMRTLPQVWVDDNFNSGTPGWGVDHFALIQDGINAVDAAGLVSVAAGVYAENIVIAKAVTISGESAAMVTVYPATTAPGDDNGPSFTGSQVIVVQAHDVTIEQITVDGNNPGLSSGVTRNLVDIDARNGIIEADGPWNNLVVRYCVVQNVYLRGIYARSGGSGFDFHHNTVTNVAGGYASIAMFAYGASGTMANNTVFYANDAISANWSRGIQFLDNTVSNSGSGVHTDNNGGFGGVADLIQGNDVSLGGGNSYGVWVFFPYLNPTVHLNTVSGQDVGLFAWGGSGGMGTFSDNTVDGTGKPGGIGIYVTSGTDAWGSWQANVSASFSGNAVSNTAFGWILETDENGDFDTSVTAASTTLTNVDVDVYTAGLGTFTVSGVAGAEVSVGWPGSIQLGINMANSGGVVDVAAGTYAERLAIGKALTLRGAQTGVDPTATGSRTNPAAESTVDIATLPITNPNVAVEVSAGTSNVTIDGFTVIGSPTFHYSDEAVIRAWSNDIAIRNNILSGYQDVLYKGPGTGLHVDANRITANKNGIVVQVGAGPGATVEGNLLTLGSSPATDAGPIYFTGINGATVEGNAMAGWSGGSAIAGSNHTNLVIRANTIAGSIKGVNLWGTTTFVTVEDNVITGCSGIGINIKGQDITIRQNVVQSNTTGITIDYHVIPTQRVQIEGNDLSGNTGLALEVKPTVTEIVDASGNWWGSNVSATVAGKVSGLVDFTPLVDSGVDTDGGAIGFQPDLSSMTVHALGSQSGTAGRVQEGVDLVSGSTVHVASGTYAEAVTVDKSVTLTGDRGNVATEGPGPNAPVMDGSTLGGNKAAFKLENGVSNVIIEGFEICNYGPDGATDADGVVAWNHGTSNVTIRDNYFHHLGWDAVLVGNEGQGIHTAWSITKNILRYGYAYGYELTNASDSSITDNIASDGTSDWAASIMIQARADGDGHTVSVSNITVSGNEISGPDRGIYVVSDADPATASASMNGVSITGNTVTGEMTALAAYKYGAGPTSVSNLTVTGNSFAVTDPKVGLYAAVSLADVAGSSTFSDNTVTVSGTIGGGGTAFHGVAIGGAATGSWTLDSNALLGNNVGTDSQGLRLRGSVPTGSMISVTNGLITGWSRGVWAEPLQATVNVSNSSLEGNTLFGIENGAGTTITALNNWWGAASGPHHAVHNPSGGGVEVSDNVLFEPWAGGNVVCLPDPLMISLADSGGNDATTVHYLGGGGGGLYGYSIDVVWDSGIAGYVSITRPTGGPFATAALFQVVTVGPGHKRVDAALGGGQPGTLGPADLFIMTLHGLGCSTGTPIDLTLNHMRDNVNQDMAGFFADDGELQVDLGTPTVSSAVITRTNLPDTGYVKDGDTIQLTATVEDACNALLIGNIVADLTAFGGGGAVAPTSYIGTLATWDFTPIVASPSNGTVTATITATDALGNVGTGSASAIADNTPPAVTVSNFQAQPGHNKVVMSWTNPGGDPNLDSYGIMIRRNAWGDYPTYADPGPAYPGATQGILAYEAAGMVTGWTETFLSTGMERDIYAYQAFVFDAAYNYSAADPGAQGMSTNYWLGDVAPISGTDFYVYTSIGDGLVDTNDISALGGTYYLTYPQPNWNPHCDVASAAGGSPTGLPDPDVFVDFEDLMIFALNYGMVAPLTGPQPTLVALGGEGRGALGLALGPIPNRVRAGQMLTVPVLLRGETGGVQGVSVALGYDATQLHYESSAVSSAIGETPHFFQGIPMAGRVGLDLALLGAGTSLTGNGVVFMAQFRVLRDGAVNLTLTDVKARDASNGDLLTQPDIVTNPAEETVEIAVLPESFGLGDARPNPFNPKTAIAYDMPQAGYVQLAIYDVTGRVVRTLWDGGQVAGSHVAEWDGRDDGGRSVGSGIYFCVMKAEGFHAQKRLTLLK